VSLGHTTERKSYQQLSAVSNQIARHCYKLKMKRSEYMDKMKIRRFIALVILLSVAGLAAASIPAAQTPDDNPSLDLPSPLCDSVQVPAGNEVTFHVYARGVQIYRWDGTSWVFVAPAATLFADANYNGQVGIHYAGPTWQSNSGSKVVATRVAGCTPDPTAIPWLRLETVSTSGPGVFSQVTYIQRVNTTGGIPPAAPGESIGAAAEVPYTAEYYFYREE
jgi:Protein of unknown function (DUF3455)